MSKPKLAVISDWVHANSGFGNVAKGILYNLRDKYDIAQLAINYSGDYHISQNDFRLYHTGDHVYGINKIAHFLKKEKPDLIFIIQDPFIADRLITKVRTIESNTPALLYTPVDSPNVPSHFVTLLNQFDHVVAYTEFGRKELLASGLAKPTSVISHGVDLELYHPVDKQEARNALGIPNDGRFIVGYIAVNQPRKKIDVWLYTINEWLKRYPHDDVYCFYHGQLQRQNGLDIPQYIQYLDRLNADVAAEHRLEERFMTTSDDPMFQVKPEYMKYMYGTLDLYFHACANGGWEMPVHEAMACKVPCIVPDYSALSEWPNGGVFYVPVTDTPDAVTSGANTVHRTLDIYWAIEALENLYQSETLRNELGNRGYEVATQDKFLWPNIALEFDTLFTNLLSRKG